MELVIQELNVVDTGIVIVWRDGADGHAYSKVNFAVANNNVL